MNCSGCGADVPAGAATCEYCGTSTASGPAEPSAGGPHGGMGGATDPGAWVGSRHSPGGFGGQQSFQGPSGKQAGGIALGIGVVLLLIGAGFEWSSSSSAKLEQEVVEAPVLTLDNLSDANGLVVIENVVPEVAAGPQTPNGVHCLYMERTTKTERRRRERNSEGRSRTRRRTNTSTHTEKAASFQIGEITIPTQDAQFFLTQQLHQTTRGSERDYDGRETVTWKGIRAEQPITVALRMIGSTHSDTGPLLVAGSPSKQALVDALERSASTKGWIGMVCVVLGLGAAGYGAFAFTRS